ncbi:MAG: glutathione peroxidase [Roseovarius sp.]|nr:glutathione peroxidase [Roseovarius sp.]
MRYLAIVFTLICALPAAALNLDAEFGNIDGGTLKLSDWAGRPILVVNTASQCGFTGQYAGLQALHDTYSARGLVVLTVPSDDFRQELASDEAVKEFCEINYGLTLPMTTITPVTGAKAHPFYVSVAQEARFEPSWNFNKILIAPDGTVAGTYGATTRPMSRKMTQAIEAILPK